MAYNPMKFKKIPKAFNDANLNSTVPLKISNSLPSDRAVSPAALAAPKAPTSIDEGQLSDRAKRFRRLAGLLGPKK